MFLENIHIAAGPLPEETGDPTEDLRNMRRYLEGLLRALERTFDKIQEKVEGQNHG